jgi:hypothetical protein
VAGLGLRRLTLSSWSAEILPDRGLAGIRERRSPEVRPSALRLRGHSEAPRLAQIASRIRTLTLLDDDLPAGNGVHHEAATRQQGHAIRGSVPTASAGTGRGLSCHSTVAQWTVAISVVPSASSSSSEPNSGSARELTVRAGSVMWPVKPVSITARTSARAALSGT